MSIKENLERITQTLTNPHCKLIAVSKTKPIHILMEAYHAGIRDFGENKVQELTEKAQSMPNDVIWHMIGHLQRNKVKYIAPFISLIHSVDSLKLLKEINKEAGKNQRIISCLLQVHIAQEETKFGFSSNEIIELLSSGELEDLNNIKIVGMMGMATNTENETQIRKEFAFLKHFFEEIKNKFPLPEFKEVSMGMSSDYHIAIEEGSTMIRVGSAIFGERDYSK
jgi:PLP dependent protein